MLETLNPEHKGINVHKIEMTDTKPILPSSPFRTVPFLNLHAHLRPIGRPQYKSISHPLWV